MNRIPIHNFDMPELAFYLEKKEYRLAHYNAPDTGYFIAESPNVIDRALTAGYEPVSFLMTTDQVEGAMAPILARYPEVPIYEANEEVLKEITSIPMTRGALCMLRRRELPSVKELIKDAKRILILENVMNPTNVGAIFRSAAALGMEAVILTKGSADPLYRRASRVSMGTVFQVDWTYFSEPWPEGGMAALRELGFKTVAMALRPDSYPIDAPEILAEERLAVIMGTEGDGLGGDTIADCDYTVCIPMTHHVDSLNVAAASAIACWVLGNKQVK